MFFFQTFSWELIKKKLKNISGYGLGHERTKKAQRNILISFVLKGFSIALGLVSMPLTIHYLEPEKFGVFITLTSVIAWFSFFDIGFGGGLRNRFAEALAKGDHLLARAYVSTTYACLTGIVLFLLIVFFIINFAINWNKVLNIGSEIATSSELRLLAIIVFTPFSISLVLRLVTTILTADQRPALASVFDLASKSITIVLVIILIKVSSGSLIYFALAQSFTTVIILAISNIWFFRGRYKEYRPSRDLVQLSKAGDLLGLGFKFFIITIANILLYQTNAIIISQLFGPKSVAPYSVAFAYFGVITLAFSIIVTPFWSAFTEAWVKREIEWIKNIINKLIGVWFLFLIGGSLMLIVSKWLFPIWIGDSVTIPYSISLLVCAWILINAFNSIFIHLLNGLGKLKTQVVINVIAAILNIPFAIFLGRKLGIEGVLLANIIVSLPGIFVYPYRYRQVILKLDSNHGFIK